MRSGLWLWILMSPPCLVTQAFSVHDFVGQWFSHRGPGARSARNLSGEESEPRKTRKTRKKVEATGRLKTEN